MLYIELKNCTNVVHTSVNIPIIPKMLLFAMLGPGSRDVSVGLLVGRSITLVQTEITPTDGPP